MEVTKKFENLTLYKFLFSVQNFPSVFISIFGSFLVCMPCQPYLLCLYIVASAVHQSASLINEVLSLRLSKQRASNELLSLLVLHSKKSEQHMFITTVIHSQRGREGTFVLLVFTQSKRTTRNFFSCWSSTVRLVKLFEEHSSWWKLY